MTRYRIALPCGTLELRVGERQPQLDACLRQAGFSCWCLLTAWNPGSRLLPREENRARQEKLKKYLLDRGHIIFSGENHSCSGGWPLECTIFVPGSSRQEGREAALLFEQNAFLAGENDLPAELLWI
ncbi:MAG: DUF3293 domain-containing protein [Azovibrio sp.]|uniref:DUF3293 domain-containing protein n=1 Tax=Azovibrio sp. TaxID=1872673 RepID=UPI003C72C5A8